MNSMEDDSTAKSKDLRDRAEQLLREGPTGLKDRSAEDIKIESDEETGTRFSVRLPVGQQE